MPISEPCVVIDAGYSIAENIFSESECDSLVRILKRKLHNKSRAGARNLMAIPEIGSLASDKRLLKICESFSGEKKIPFKVTLFEKTGKANWLVAFHQDTALPLEKSSVVDEGWGPSSKKQGINFVHAPTWALSQITAIRIHLDPSTALSGPLRVIPGSQYERILTDVEYARVLKSRPEVQCLVGKGGVIAMSPLILHASSKAKSDDPRRVLHIEYAKSLNLAPEIKLAIA